MVLVMMLVVFVNLNDLVPAGKKCGYLVAVRIRIESKPS